MPKPLGKRESGWLRAFYRGPDFPTKMRFWGWMRRIQGYRPLTVSYGKAGWIVVDERDLLQREIFVSGSYEREVWEMLRDFIRSDEVVWDIGAHVGAFSIRAVTDPRVKEVHAFEPDPIHAQTLSVNLSLNRSRSRIHQVALSDRPGMGRLYHGPLANTGLSSLVPSNRRDEVFEVECATADQLVFEEGIPPPTLMKVDVEGWEQHVFRGARRLLETAAPKAIVFEAASGPFDLGVRDTPASFLEQFGYCIQWIKRPSGAFEEKENYLASRRAISEIKI